MESLSISGWELNPALLICGIAVFLLGSIPFGLLIARLWNVGDLRSRGSGNIGATNVSRVVGFWPAGFLTFAFDVFKGLLPVALLTSGALNGLFAQWGWTPGAFELWALGFCSVLGHCYSPWLNFHGGKGVATGFGVILVLAPVAALAGIAAFALMFLLKRTGSLASLAALGTVTVTFLVFHPMETYMWWGGALIALIATRHETNIDALLSDSETVFK